MGWGWLREVAEVAAPVMKYDLVHKVDTRIANETADALRKTPLGKKDQILAKQSADTVDYGEQPQQIANQAQVAGTIALVAYGVGASGGESAAAGGEGALAVNSFDTGAMASSVGYTAPLGSSAGAAAGGGSLLGKVGSMGSTAKDIGAIVGTLGALGKPAGGATPTDEAAYLPIGTGAGELSDDFTHTNDKRDIALLAAGGALLGFLYYKA